MPAELRPAANPDDIAADGLHRQPARPLPFNGCHVSMIVSPAILWTISLGALLWGAVSDLRLRIIPDRVSLLVALSGLTIAYGFRSADLYASLGAATLVFSALCCLAYYDVVGGGDVKLISAVCLLVPSNDVVVLLLEIALAGGLLSCTYLLVRFRLKRELLSHTEGTVAVQSPWRAASHSFQQEAARISAGEPMPYAFAILGGVVLHVAREFYQCHSAVCSLS